VDLYALGIVLFELLAGKPPFTEGEVTYHHLHTKPEFPSAKRKEISEELQKIVMQLLEKDPDRRFQNAKDVKVSLEAVSV